MTENFLKFGSFHSSNYGEYHFLIDPVIQIPPILCTDLITDVEEVHDLRHFLEIPFSALPPLRDFVSGIGFLPAFTHSALYFTNR